MKKFRLIVEGRRAMFTQPALKVERVSYAVPTISALEGLLKSVYWKPAMRYVIDRIVVFNEIKYENIRTNEVKVKPSLKKIMKAMDGTGEFVVINTTDTKSVRTQRTNMLLKNVKYGIEFHIELTGLRADDGTDCIEKHNAIFERRMQKGQYFKSAYLGCREYGISSLKLVDKFNYNEVSEALHGVTSLGRMLYAVRFLDKGVPINNNWERPVFEDRIEPVYYCPIMRDGVIDVESYREGLGDAY